MSARTTQADRQRALRHKLVRGLLNDEFRVKITEVMRKRYGVEVENTWGFIAQRLVTRRADGEDFTLEQMRFLEGYSEGFAAAMELVGDGPDV